MEGYREPPSLPQLDDDQFTIVGLGVLVVDNNPESLDHLTSLLRAQNYNVTPATDASTAFEMVCKDLNRFDVIIVEVRVDGAFEFLTNILQVTDDKIPVLMISESDDIKTVRSAVMGGACKFQAKPLREQEIQTIWQHVYRKKLTLSSQDQPPPPPSQDHGSVSEQEQQENGKKPRMRWVQELDDRFMEAVKGLRGLDKAVPMEILRAMNVPTVTRAQVASHLQKVRDQWRKRNPPPVKEADHDQANYRSAPTN
ncbi:hypothetical protein Dimus_027624 [Dionaea muscipula]